MDSTNMLDLHYHHHPEELLLHWNQHPSLNSAERICDEQQQQQQIQNVINPCLSYHMVQDLAKVKHEEETLLLNYNSALPVPINGSFGFDPSSFGMFLPSSFTPFQTSEQFSRMAPFFDNINYGVQHHLQGQTSARSCITFNEMPGSVNGSKRVVANSSNMDQLKPPKKPRFDSRPSSLSPFKVRKEKLGDRIAALQQLVAPFGKTDTASVLMEAIGYIKFLQDQVETLSVPYIGQSNNRKLHMSLQATDDERDESKPDLRTRGLCLVPLSCTSYVTNDNIVWSPPNFR